MRSTTSIVAQARVPLLLLIALACASCGGGGGGGDGGGGGGGGGSTTISVSPSTISVTADTAVGTAPTATIDITLGNVPSGGAYVGWDFTQNGIDNADLQESAPSNGVVNITFKNPVLLGPGTYTDTVQIGLCTDQSCTAVRAGTLHTVTVTYTVTGAALSVSVSPASVNVQALPFLQVAPQATLTVSLQGVPPSGVGVTADSTNVAAYMAGIGGNGTGGYTVNLSFKTPSTLAPGEYDDTVTVNVCLIPGCVPVPGSPFSVPVHYLVSGTVTGTNGYTARSVAITATDMAADPAGGQLYLSVPASAASNANSIIVLDPAAATLGASIAGLADPGILAISNDGAYLYAAMHGASSVERYTLPGLTSNLSIAMGSDASGALFADELQVAPAAGSTLAVVRRHSGAGGFDVDAAVFDDAVQRTATLDVTSNSSLRLQWSAAGDGLYGIDAYAWFGPIITTTVDASGITPATSLQTTQLQTNPGRLHLDGTQLYTDDGRVFSTTPAVTYLGNFAVDPASIPVATLPNSGASKAYVLVTGGASDTYLESYDLSTRNAIARIALPGVAFRDKPARMVRWGPDGLAILCQDQVILVNGPFVAP